MTNVLTLGHNLLQDPDIHTQHVDSITRTVQSVEQRWKALRDLLTKRRFEYISSFFKRGKYMCELFRLDSVQDPWRDMDEAIRRATRMVSDHEEILAEIKRTSANGLQGVQDEYRNLEVCENDFHSSVQ